MACPICGGETQQATRPFCSTRCADADLVRWMTGAYRVAGRDGESDPDGEIPRDPPPPEH